MVNATAGTTVLGAFDPIDEISDICEKHHLWLHVDVSSLPNSAVRLILPVSQQLPSGFSSSVLLRHAGEEQLSCPRSTSTC